MRQYAPTPSTYHRTIPLIDDSDAPNASNFNPAPEALADNGADLFGLVEHAGRNWPRGLQLWTSLPGTLGGTVTGLSHP
ncbi:hypothetical protein OEZ79_27430, partial [Leclercia adecarboxylata]